jgi:hypothetical protein
MRARSRPIFVVEHQIQPNPIEIGGIATHTVTVKAFGERHVVADLSLKVRDSTVVRYQTAGQDGKVWPSKMDFPLTRRISQLRDARSSTIEHDDQAAACANLPHVSDSSLSWGFPTGLPQPYGTNSINFTCTKITSSLPVAR